MRTTLASALRLLLACLALAAAVTPADAQLLDVPPFVAFDYDYSARRFGSYSVAAGSDSSILALAETWTRSIDNRQTVVQAFAPAGSPVGAMIRVDEDKDSYLPAVIADTRGGFIATFHLGGLYGLPFAARLLGPTGAPTGPGFTVSPSAAYQGAAAALPAGMVFAWNDGSSISGRLYDVGGQPSGPVFTVTSFDFFAVVPFFLAAKSDGGFVIVWWQDGWTRGRFYDAAGSPLGGVVDLAAEFGVNDVAASPLGGIVVVGRRPVGTHALGAGVWARRFDDAGTAAGPSFPVELLDPTLLAWPHAAFDAAGRLYVVWGLQGAVGAFPHGRLYDAAGNTLQASFRIVTEFAGDMILTPRPDGRFIEGWSSHGDLKLQVRTLCVPPDHTGCGDGVLQAPCERCDDGLGNSDTTPDACRTTCMVPSCGDGVVDHNETCDDGNRFGCDGCDATCQIEAGWVCGDGVVSGDCEEQCDDGPGNDDTTPNACRTSCLRAHCGDGVRDAGEGCDDGNLVSCDGCSDRCVPEPGLVCGDGIPEVLCGEQCDDGNTVDGDGCTEPCSLERVPGGGSSKTDCKIAWVVDNPTNVPLYDKNGAINGVQSCVDGDPRCDFDGGVAGSCTFHLRVCANNTGMPQCEGGPRLRSWELRTPSAAKAAKHPELAAVRAAFTSVPGAIVGPTLANVCSGTLDVAIPVRGAKAGSLVLKSYATLFTGEKDADKIRLSCLP